MLSLGELALVGQWLVQDHDAQGLTGALGVPVRGGAGGAQQRGVVAVRERAGDVDRRVGVGRAEHQVVRRGRAPHADRGRGGGAVVPVLVAQAGVGLLEVEVQVAVLHEDQRQAAAQRLGDPAAAL
ncbi:hypothetical protein GCM10020295_30780 [Streptomyces cinereospinus]